MAADARRFPGRPDAHSAPEGLLTSRTVMVMPSCGRCYADTAYSLLGLAGKTDNEAVLRVTGSHWRRGGEGWRGRKENTVVLVRDGGEGKTGHGEEGKGEGVEAWAVRGCE